jgi:hypothetical protein
MSYFFAVRKLYCYMVATVFNGGYLTPETYGYGWKLFGFLKQNFLDQHLRATMRQFRCTPRSG